MTIHASGGRNPTTGRPGSKLHLSNFMKPKILIVDDEPNIRDSLAKALRGAGYEPCVAADGLEACMFYEQHQPDLVLLDLNMPILNGWKTFEAISTVHPLVPVIIITGRPGQFELAAAARVGALMEKPLDVPTLLETVRRLLDEPLSARLSRLQFQRPHTAFIGTEASRGSADDPVKMVELLRLRKRQLDELRNGAGNPTGDAPNSRSEVATVRPGTRLVQS